MRHLVSARWRREHRRAIRVMAGARICAAVIGGLGQPASGEDSPAGALARSLAGPLGHTGRWITDARGRVVILHGLSMVNKLPPYTPAAAGFGSAAAATLADNGFDVVRVGIIYRAVEPRPVLQSQFDEPPSEDPGLVKVSVPEARRLLRLATTPMTATAGQLGHAWSRWRRKHQARARYHHYQARLRAAPA